MIIVFDFEIKTQHNHCLSSTAQIKNCSSIRSNKNQASGDWVGKKSKVCQAEKNGEMGDDRKIGEVAPTPFPSPGKNPSIGPQKPAQYPCQLLW